MITLESIEKKLGFDPLRYVIKNDDHGTGDGRFNPYSILSNEELDFIMDTFRKQKKNDNTDK